VEECKNAVILLKCSNSRLTLGQKKFLKYCRGLHYLTQYMLLVDYPNIRYYTAAKNRDQQHLFI
jgi:hypothetical protein